MCINVRIFWVHPVGGLLNGSGWSMPTYENDDYIFPGQTELEQEGMG